MSLLHGEEIGLIPIGATNRKERDMTREEKVRKRKERAQRRIQKRLLERNKILSDVRFNNLPFHAARHKAKHGYYNSWPDSNSPTGYTQVCDYFGTCQSPCNGDC